MEMELESILLPGVDPQRPIIISGPCSAETEEQVMDAAHQLASKVLKYSVPESGNPVLNREDSKVSEPKACSG